MLSKLTGKQSMALLTHTSSVKKRLNLVLNVSRYKYMRMRADSAGFGGMCSGWAIFKRAFKSCQRRWSTVSRAVPCTGYSYAEELTHPVL